MTQKHTDYFLHGDEPILSVYVQYSLSSSMMVALHTFILDPINPRRSKFVCYPQHYETLLQFDAIIKKGGLFIPEAVANWIIRSIKWKIIEVESDSDSD